MTSWRPNLAGRSSPIYLAIVSALAEDVAAGRLAEGVRLPTHRDLADALGVTVGTVTRAYAEAHRRHLVTGEVGRGTFVRDRSPLPSQWQRHAMPDPRLTDLSIARPVAPLAAEALADALRSLAGEPGLGALFDYQPDAGMPAHRAAIAEWVARRGVPAEPSQVVITSGTEHAIAMVLSAIAHPDDVILCEALTYPNIRSLAAAQHLRLVGVAMDEQGLLPAAFEQACRAGPVRALYTIPTVQNPTSSVLSLERRRAVAEIARAHDVILIEDEVFGFLCPDPPASFAALAPERTIHLSSFSKLLAGGLRVGYAVAPPALAARVAQAVFTNLIMVAPLLAELAVRWVRDGTALRQVERQRAATLARHRQATERLAGLTWQGQPHSSLVWLTLPAPWRADDFATQARQQGVLVSPSPLFHAGRGEPPSAVRLGLGGAGGAALDRALDVVAQLARGQPAEAPRIV